MTLPERKQSLGAILQDAFEGYVCRRYRLDKDMSKSIRENRDIDPESLRCLLEIWHRGKTSFPYRDSLRWKLLIVHEEIVCQLEHVKTLKTLMDRGEGYREIRTLINKFLAMSKKVRRIPKKVRRTGYGISSDRMRCEIVDPMVTLFKISDDTGGRISAEILCKVLIQWLSRCRDDVLEALIDDDPRHLAWLFEESIDGGLCFDCRVEQCQGSNKYIEDIVLEQLKIDGQDRDRHELLSELASTEYQERRHILQDMYRIMAMPDQSLLELYMRSVLDRTVAQGSHMSQENADGFLRKIERMDPLDDLDRLVMLLYYVLDAIHSQEIERGIDDPVIRAYVKEESASLQDMCQKLFMGFQGATLSRQRTEQQIPLLAIEGLWPDPAQTALP